MNDGYDEILQEFILETRDHLSAIEPDLLEMENQGEQVSSEIVNRIFRAVHSTKGGASFLSFESLKSFSHVMENVLMQLRDGELACTPNVVDVLLRSVDVLSAMIEDVQNSDQVPCKEETELLNALIEKKNSNIPKEEAKAVSDQPEPPREQRSDSDILSELDATSDAVKSTLAEGMLFYRVTLNVGEDIQDKGLTFKDVIASATSIGKCLWFSSDPDNSEDLLKGHLFEFICATVLDLDMLSQGLDIPAERLKQIDVTPFKDKYKGQEEEKKQQTPKVAPTSTKGSVAKKEVKETLRVKVDLLTDLMNMAGELVLGRNQLLRLVNKRADEIPGLTPILQNLDHVTTELQEGIMQTRMQPIGILFSRYSRVVRDMSRSLGKEVELHVEGSEVELDKSIIEMLADPLVHVVRNCVDHAIEPPVEREQMGKSRGGKITLRAFHQGGHVNILINDDGRGISSKKIIKKAIEKGIVTEADAAKMSQRDIVNLVMTPGFSTAAQVSDISGRGVGMDVVRTNIEKLGGQIELETIEGYGTTVLLSLPLTLAIIPSLIVSVQDAVFAVPQVSIVELVIVYAKDVKERIEKIQGASVLRLRGKLLPLVRLADLLCMEQTYTDPETGEIRDNRRKSITDRRFAKNMSSGNTADCKDRRRNTERREHYKSDYHILVLRSGANQFGVIVDELLDMEEIVVKPLSSYLKKIKCFAGTTILGDGRVIMILDPLGISEIAELRFSDLKREERRRKGQTDQDGSINQRSVILFNSASDEVFAVPQEKILRLEKIDRNDIEQMGNRHFIKYQGAGLPIIMLDECLPVKPLPSETDELFLIIPKYYENGKAVQTCGGIIASQVIDAMDVNIALQRPFFDGPGVEGTAVIDDNLTLFLDPIELLKSTGLTSEAPQ
ncbi:MAG: chemotaxis protein CheA [Myxococcota bacterium]|nr:chemotaxis protein CheA [Myxococcota bacterium]